MNVLKFITIITLLFTLFAQPILGMSQEGAVRRQRELAEQEEREFQEAIRLSQEAEEEKRGKRESEEEREAREFQEAIRLSEEAEVERQRKIEKQIRAGASIIQGKAQEMPGQGIAFTDTERKLIKQLGMRRLVIIFEPGFILGDKVDALWSDLAAALNEPGASAPIITSFGLAQQYASNGNQELLHAWDIYILRNHPNCGEYVIFIPKDDVQNKFGINNFTDEEIGNFRINSLSIKELILGIKLNKLTKVNALQLSRSSGESFDNQGVRNNLPKGLEQILISRVDFGKDREKEVYLNRWDIYLTGHGGSGIIANMPLNIFSRLLDWFNEKINTRSLFYDTCFAGGTHLTEPYQDPKDANGKGQVLAKDLNYLVISATTFEARTSVPGNLGGMSSFGAEKPFFKLIGKKKFAQYFDRLDHFLATKQKERTQVMALSDIVGNLTDWKNTFNPASLEWINLPAVRFPHTDRFITLEDKAIFSINDNAIMRAVNASKREIIVPEAAEVIVLESTYVPIPIVIKGNKLPLIIPKSLNISYFLSELRAPEINFVSKDNSLGEMVQRVGRKTKATGGFLLIEKLTINLDKQKGTPWAKGQITCQVMVTLANMPKIPTMIPLLVRACIGDECYDYNARLLKWEKSTRALFDDLWNRYIESAKESSTLPESMRKKEPKPLISIEQTGALKGYM